MPQTYRKIVLSEDGTIKTELFTVSGRKIPLSDHQGLVRTTKDEHYATMTTKQADDKLAFLGETHNLPESATLADKKEYLKQLERTRHQML